MRLPKSIIKKYGISKKAWLVFRGEKKAQTKTHAEVKTMARRRTKKFGRKSYSKSSGMGVKDILVAGALYGAIRSPAVSALGGIINMVPLGKYSDNAVMGVASYMLTKFGGNGIVGKVGKAGMLIETSIASSEILGNVMQGTAVSSSFGGY